MGDDSALSLVPLALMREGERGTVHTLPDNYFEVMVRDKEEVECVFCGLHRRKGDHGFSKICNKLLYIGLRPGQIVEVKQNQTGNPLLIRIGDEMILALSRGIAMKILVVKCNK